MLAGEEESVGTGTTGHDGEDEWVLAPGWHPDPATAGLLRYWTGDRWTGRTRPEPSAVAAGAVRRAPVGPAWTDGGLDPYGPGDELEQEWATVGPRRSRRARRAAAVLAAVLVLALVGAAVVPVVEGGGRAAPGAGGVPGLVGYRPLRVTGAPVAAGRPWGVACAPVTILAAGPVPAVLASSLASAAAAARAAGVAVDVVLGGRGRRFARVVDVVPLATAAGHGADPLRLSATGVRPTDGRAARLGRVTATVRVGGLGAGRLGLVARQVVAAAAGVGGSSAPGSGIAARGHAERFSQGDLAAMARMAGCTEAPRRAVAA